MASTAGSVPAFLLQFLAALFAFTLRADAETLQLSFGTSSAIAGYEVVSAASMFAQWSGGAKYFGSCFGGHWIPFGGASDAQSDGSALGTWSTLASGTFFCLLNVPLGSYQLEVIAGNTPAESSTCLELPDGSQVLQSTMPSGTTSTGTAVIHQTTAESVCIKACAANSVINVWITQRLSCHVSCTFCTGASSSACALSCNEGRTLVSRDGGSYCDARVPYAPGGPTTSAVTDEGATLSWNQPSSGGSVITGYRIEVAVGASAVFTELVANTLSSATSFQVTGLAGGETYRFVVAGINGVGVGESSPPSVSITTLPRSPDPPAAAWIENITSSSMAVYWSEPTKDGGRPITMYTVQIAEAESNETFYRVVNTSLLTCVLTSLQGATTYRIRVIAENEIGLSEPKETANAVTQSPVVPLPPSITALSMNAPYQATLSWMAPEDQGGRPVIKYTVSAGLSVGNVEPVASIDAGSDPVHAQIGQLLGSTSYAFQVAAVNIVGTSDAARIVAMTPAPTQAAAPGVPSVSNIGQNLMDLTWTEPAHDGGSRILGYRIWVAVHGLWSIATDCNSTCDNSTTISGLEGNTGYRFALQALTAFGPGFQSGISTLAFTAEVPPFQPGKPWAREVQQHQLVLEWDAPANDGGLDLVAYQVWKRSGAASDWTVVVNSTGSNETSMFLQGLEGNTQYSFMIAGFNSLGIGHVSMSDSVSTLPIPPGAPNAPIVENVTWSSIYVTWSAPAKNGGMPITGYVIELADNSNVFQPMFNISNNSELSSSLTGLSGAAVYQVRVIAKNAIGSSDPGPASIAITWPPDVPDSPSILSIHFLAPYEAKVSWTAPADDRGRPIIRYAVSVRGIDLLQEEMFFAAAGSELYSTTLTGLLGSTACEFRVHAVNSVGWSVFASVSSMSPPAVQAAACSNVQVSNVQQHMADVTWKEPLHHGGSLIIGYRIWAVRDDGWTWVSDCNNSCTNATTFIGLSGNTLYRFQVQAITGIGVGMLSATSDLVLTAPTPPGPPGQVNASLVGKYEVQLEWSPPISDGGAVVFGYQIWERTISLPVWIMIANLSADNSTVFSLQNRLAGTTYEFAVAAVNSVGEGECSTSSDALLVPFYSPDAPDAPSITQVTQSSMTVTWIAPSRDGGSPITGYTIELSMGEEDFQQVLNTSNYSILMFHLTGLAAGMAYQIRVTASNEIGTSAPSGACSATTLPSLATRTAISNTSYNSSIPSNVTVTSHQTALTITVSSATTLPSLVPGNAFSNTSHTSSIQSVMTTVTHRPNLATTRRSHSSAPVQIVSSSTPTAVSSTTALPGHAAGSAFSNTLYTSSIPSVMTTITHWPTLTTTRGQQLTHVTTSVWKMWQTTSTTQEMVEGANLNTPARTTESLLSTSTTFAKKDACPLGMAIDGLQCVTQCTARGEVLVLRGASGEGLACEARTENSRPARVAFTLSRMDPFPVDLLERLLRAVASASVAAGASGIRFGVTEVTSGNMVQDAAARHRGG